MPNIYRGRHSTTIEGRFVIFLIGLRVNRLLGLHKWLSVGSEGRVGIWHETYQVANGQYACAYATMRKFGLALSGGYQTAEDHLRDARSRIRSDTDTSNT